MNLSKIIVLFVITSICFLINLDYSALSLAILPISLEFHAPTSTVDWILGAYALAWAICIIPAGIFSENFYKKGGKWVDKIGIKIPVCSGFFLLGTSTALLLFLNVHSSIFSILFSFILLGSGMGLAFVGLNSGVIKVVAETDVSLASSIFVLLSLLGNSIGVAIASSSLAFSYLLGIVILISLFIIFLAPILLKEIKQLSVQL